jgi:hypothetical protein
LGLITKVRPLSVIVALPNNCKAYLSINNISKTFTTQLLSKVNAHILNPDLKPLERGFLLNKRFLFICFFIIFRSSLQISGRKFASNGGLF